MNPDGDIMRQRKQQAALRQVASTLDSWPEPHGHPELNIKGVDLQNGQLKIAIQPHRPQCPCCLLDLAALRKSLLKKKGIELVHMEIVGVPAADRWTRTINS